MRGSGHRVVLCADDFGLSKGVSEGIIDLVDMGRLSATSAMVNHRWWRTHGPELKRFGPSLGVGLHLTLTSGPPLGSMPALAPDGRFPALGRLLPRALAGALPLDELRGEIERQLDAFEAVFGSPPAFVDGHQHVHVLPGVRRALLATLQRRGLNGRLWLRDPSDSVRPIVRRRRSAEKALLLRFFAVGFRRQAIAAGFETNEGFSGFSAFSARTSVEGEFQRFFLRLGRRPVVMCHPGYVDAELARIDPVVGTRSLELMYLSSERFTDLLEVLGITLVPRPMA